MRRFELWLDESGDFENDKMRVNRTENPSLIGGLLIENNTFADQEVSMIIPEAETYHSVEKSDQLTRFRKIDERLFRNPANRLVVFSNQECIMILDNNVTYLNIISQGILQVLKYLNAQYGDVFLRVVIANRVDTTVGDEYTTVVVKNEEYVKRLREKLLVEGLQESITEEEWELLNESARKDKRLMLADIVCNTFFTRYRDKFNKEEKEYIESVYFDKNKTLVFSVFESILEKNFKGYLLDNKVGEAVSEICLSDDQEMLQRCFDLLRLRFNGQGLNNVRFQYKFVNAYIEYYINVVRDYGLIVRFLRNLLNYYVPLLAEQREASMSRLDDRMRLDIKFYLWTAYTHLGDVANSKLMQEECEAELLKFPPSLYTMEHRIKFENRKIVALCNAFEFKDALELAESHVQKCKEIKDLLSLVSGEESPHYDELAKAIAARMQVINFMLRQNPDLYEEGVSDSDEAIAEFVEYRDKKRQYLYRVHLETESGNYDRAYAFLCKAVGTGSGVAGGTVDGASGGLSAVGDITDGLEADRDLEGGAAGEEEDSANALAGDADAKMVWRLAESESSYASYAYIRLMAESAGSWEKADEMYDALSGSEYVKEVMKREVLFHPYEAILWKYGYYCAQRGMANAALDAYGKAIESCFATWPDLTLNVIGMGICFEKIAFLIQTGSKQVKSFRKQMAKKWKSIEDEGGGKMLERAFGEVDLASDSHEYFWEMSRRITY